MQALTVFPTNQFRWLIIKSLLIEKPCPDGTFIDGIAKKSLVIFKIIFHHLNGSTSSLYVGDKIYI